MTRKDLELIHDAEKKINLLKLELEALRYKASGAGGIRYDKDRVQTSQSDYMTMAIADAIELDKHIKDMETEIEEKKGEAYAIVRKMNNPDQRAVIEWYYLNGLSMIDTANKLNISERSAYYLKEDALTEFTKHEERK
jgi:DNA-directed RNA polymerase specialized sigma subunit